MKRSFSLAGLLVASLALSTAALAKGNGGGGGASGDAGSGGQSPLGVIDLINEDANQRALALVVAKRKRAGNCLVAACAPDNDPPRRRVRHGRAPDLNEPCGTGVILIHRDQAGQVSRYTCREG